MEEVLGVLFSSGYTLDQVLDLSWDQIELSSRCIYRHKISMLEMIFEPISVALGGKKSKRKRKSSNNSIRKNKNLSAEQKDAVLLGKIRSLGIPIN